MKNIAFIGLGNMGAPMAENLVKAEYALTVFDLLPASLERLKAKGAKIAGSANDAVKGADLVISMLPSSPHVESLYIEESKLLEAIANTTLVIDCSTIAPDSARKVSAAALEKGITMLDAPVSGGTAGAAAGNLTFIVGGPKDAFEKAKAVLSAMGKNIFYAGESGNGQVAKICNNMLLAIHMIGTSEAIKLGVKNGIDPTILCDIMKVSSGKNWSLELYNPYPGIMDNVPSSKGYQGGFGSRLMLKDLGLAMQASDASSSKTPLGHLAQRLYQEHCEHDELAALDFSSIIKSL